MTARITYKRRYGFRCSRRFFYAALGEKKNEGCNVVFVTQLPEDTEAEFAVNNNPLTQAPKNSVAVANGDGSINLSS